MPFMHNEWGSGGEEEANHNDKQLGRPCKNRLTRPLPRPRPLHLPLANASQTNLSTFMRHKSHLIGIFYLLSSLPLAHTVPVLPSPPAPLLLCLAVFFHSVSANTATEAARCRRAFILGTKCVLHMRERRQEEAGAGRRRRDRARWQAEYHVRLSYLRALCDL